MTNRRDFLKKGAITGILLSGATLTNSDLVAGEKGDKTMDERKYALKDLTEKELALIYRLREDAKDGKRYANYFWGSMLLCLVLVIALSQYFHNAGISLLSFMPMIIVFVINSRRNRRIKLIVQKMVGQAKEEQS